MKLTEFISILDTYTPTGYSMYATSSRNTYNQNKDVQNTMLVVLPNPYPSFWRESCSQDVKFSIWFGKVVPIKTPTHLTQQHDPYSALELRDELFATINTYLESLNTSENIQVLTAPNLMFYDQPDGMGVNAQVWCEVNITARLFNVPGFVEPTYIVDENGNNVVDENGNYLTL